jgi:hypothetical protein
VGGSCGDWMELAQDRDRWRVLVGTVRNLRVLKMWGIWLAAEPVSFSRRTLLHGVSKCCWWWSNPIPQPLCTPTPKIRRGSYYYFFLHSSVSVIYCYLRPDKNLEVCEWCGERRTAWTRCFLTWSFQARNNLCSVINNSSRIPNKCLYRTVQQLSVIYVGLA